MTRQEAIQKAHELTRQTGRKHVVRSDYGKCFVCPLYREDNRYYPEADKGYAALGLLVKESL